MKPTIAIAIAALALPLFAADEQKPANTSTVLSAAPQPQVDSPLVRAAKASGRLGKKPTMVITNESLVREGGHFTTTSADMTAPMLPPLKVDPAKSPEALRRAKLEADAKAARDAADKDSADKKAKKLQRVGADFIGDSIEERVDDPAMQEHLMNQMTSTQPQTQNPPKPPQQ